MYTCNYFVRVKVYLCICMYVYKYIFKNWYSVKVYYWCIDMNIDFMIKLIRDTTLKRSTKV